VRRRTSPSTAGRTNRRDLLGLGLSSGIVPRFAGTVGHLDIHYGGRTSVVPGVRVDSRLAILRARPHGNPANLSFG
jgi:hypothetical protein